MQNLGKLQSDAIKNVKIDKVTVWDSGKSADGKSSTANFLSGLYGSVPPLEEVFKMAGLTLPGYLKGEEEKNGESPVSPAPPKQGGTPSEV